MVTSGQQNKATHTHKTKSENDAYIFLIQLFENLIFIPCFRWIRAQERGLQKTGTKCDPLILWKGDLIAWWYCGDFFGMFRKKIEILLIDVITALLRGAPSAVSEFEVSSFFLDTVSCFASVGLRFLKCSKIGHTRRWGLLTREITLNYEILSQSLPDRKVLFMTLKQLFEVFVRLSVFDCSRATCILLWGQNQRWVTSEWVNARKTSKISKEAILRSHQSDQKCRQKILQSYIGSVHRGFPWQINFSSNFGFLIYHLTGKSIGTCIDMDHILSRITFCPWQSLGWIVVRFHQKQNFWNQSLTTCVRKLLQQKFPPTTKKDKKIIALWT